MKIFLFIVSLVLLSTAQAQTLERIKASKTITIAHRADALPFSFDQNGDALGYTTDICRRVVASIQQQLKLADLKIKWLPATGANRMQLVADHKADMECGATTVTLGRMEQVDFSNLVFVDGGALLALKTGNYQSVADLAGKKIAVIGGTSTQDALNKSLKERMVSAQVVPVKAREDGLAAVENGTVDAFASDAVLLSGLAPKAKDPDKLAVVGQEMLSFEPYAIVLPRGDWKFRLAVNRGLAELYRSGDISQIFNKYFGNMGEPSHLLMANYFLNGLPE